MASSWSDQLAVYLYQLKPTIDTNYPLGLGLRGFFVYKVCDIMP